MDNFLLAMNYILDECNIEKDTIYVDYDVDDGTHYIQSSLYSVRNIAIPSVEPPYLFDSATGEKEYFNNLMEVVHIFVEEYKHYHSIG